MHRHNFLEARDADGKRRCAAAAVPMASAFAKSPERVNSAKKPPTMESPAPVEFISVPFAAGAKYTSPVSVYKSAPSPAMETSTFSAPAFFQLLRKRCHLFLCVRRGTEHLGKLLAVRLYEERLKLERRQ